MEAKSKARGTLAGDQTPDKYVGVQAVFVVDGISRLDVQQGSIGKLLVFYGFYRKHDIAGDATHVSCMRMHRLTLCLTVFIITSIDCFRGLLVRFCVVGCRNGAGNQRGCYPG